MLFDFLLNLLLLFLLLRACEKLLGLNRYDAYNQSVVKITTPLLKWFGKDGQKSGLYFALLFVFVLKCIFFMAERPKLEPVQMVYSFIVFNAEYPVIRDAFFKSLITFVVFIFRIEFFLLICFLFLQNALFGGFIGFLQQLIKPIIFLKNKMLLGSKTGADFKDIALLIFLTTIIIFASVALNPNRIILLDLYGKEGTSLFLHILISLLGVLVKDLSLLMWFIIIKALSSWLGGFYSNPIMYFVSEVSGAVLKPFYRFNLQIGVVDLTPMVVLFGFYFLQNVLLNILFIVYRSF